MENVCISKEHRQIPGDVSVGFTCILYDNRVSRFPGDICGDCAGIYSVSFSTFRNDMREEKREYEKKGKKKITKRKEQDTSVSYGNIMSRVR